MFRPPSVRATFTTLAAAAVLVGGADLVSYAANGHPLLLAQANRAVGTTTLKNAGRGPALSLNSSKHSAPFKVNSKKMVRHLNANLVHGRTAGQLEPKTITFRLGSVGQSFAGGTVRFFSARVPKGTYEVAVSGLITQSSTDPGDNYSCVIADKATLLRVLSGTVTRTDLTGIYALDGDKSGGFKYGVVGNVNPVQSLKSSSIAYGCQFNSSVTPTPDSFVTSRPVIFTLRQVTRASKGGAPLPVSRTAAANLARALR